jgi:PAS domain S-box-containing protein
MRALTDLLWRYSISLAVTALALLLTIWIWPLSQRFPFALFLIAVMIGAFQGGPRAGMVTTALSFLALILVHAYLPTGEVAETAGQYLPRLAIFVLVGILASYLSQQCRRAVLAIERIHGVIGGIGEALIFTDAQGRVTYLNRPAESLTRWQLAAVTDQVLEQVFPVVQEGTRQPVKDLLGGVLRDGRIVGLPDSLVLVPATGAETPIEGMAAPIRAADDSIVGASILFRDVSARRQMEREVRQRAQEFGMMAAHSPAGMMMLDPKGRCVYTNPAWQELGGFTLEESLGDGWVRCVHPLDRDRLLNEWSACAAAGLKYTQEFRLQTGPEPARWLRLRATPMHTETGKLLGYVANLDEITSDKQADARLRADNETLLLAVEEANARAEATRQQADAAQEFSDATLRKVKENLQCQLSEQLESHQRTAEMLRQQRDELERQFAEQAAARQLAELSLENARRDFEQRFAEHQTAHAQAAEELRQLQATHHARLEQQAADHRDFEQRFAEHQTAHAQTAEELRLLQATHHARLEQQAADHRQAEESWCRALEELERQLAERTASQTQSEEALRQAREDHEKLLADQIEPHRRENDRLVNEHNQVLSHLRAQLTNQEEANSALRAQLSRQEQATGELQEHLKRHQATNAELQCRLAEHQAGHADAAQALAHSQQQAESLRWEKAGREQLIHGSLDPLVAFDRDGRCLVWNPAMEHLSGIGQSEALGRPVGDLLPLANRDEANRYLAETLAGNHLAVTDNHFLGAANGQARTLEGYFTPLQGPAGEWLGGMAIFRERQRIVYEPAVEPLPIESLTNGDGATSTPQPHHAPPLQPADWLAYN